MYSNEKLLNFKQYFASDADYVFFARSLYEQHHLRSSINFAIYKINPGKFTAGIFNSNFKRKVETFAASNNASSFMSLVKRTTHTGNLEIVFVWCTIAMVKELEIHTYFLTLSWADLRWELLAYIIDKLNNFGISYGELKCFKLSKRM